MSSYFFPAGGTEPDRLLLCLSLTVIWVKAVVVVLTFTWLGCVRV